MAQIPIDEPFCDDCGSILPIHLLGPEGISCYYCNKKFLTAIFKDVTMKYNINFNPPEIEEENVFRNMVEDQDEGPVVDRKCPRCNNEKMSYATLQLRSADEGQTVFYTCTNCKYKETENS